MLKISGLSIGLVGGYLGSGNLVRYLFMDIDNNSEYLHKAIKNEFGTKEAVGEVENLKKVQFLDFSKTYKIDEKKEKLIYFNGTRSQGHKGVTHGGYTYTVSNHIGLEYLKKLGLPPPTKTFTRYKKPSYIGNEHHATTFINEEGLPCVEITDKAGDLISFTTFTS